MLQKSLLREPAEGITRRAASRTPPSLADVAVVEETLRAALGPDLELNVNLAPEIQIEPDVKFHGSHRLVRNAYEMTGAR